MADHLASYLDRLRTRNYAVNTLANYGRTLRRLDAFLRAFCDCDLSNRVASVHPDHMRAFQAHLLTLPLCARTRNQQISHVQGFFAFLVADKILADDPSTVLYATRRGYDPAPPDPAKERIYRPEELQRLVGALSRKAQTSVIAARDLALVMLYLCSALRVSEACSLNAGQVEEMRHGAVQCRCKGGWWKRVTVSARVVPFLLRYLAMRPDSAPDAPLFLSSRGNRLNRKKAWATIARRQRKAGLKTGQHLFRHIALNAVFKVGGLTMAAQAARHRSLQTTTGYLHDPDPQVLDAYQAVEYAGLLQPCEEPE